MERFLDTDSRDRPATRLPTSLLFRAVAGGTGVSPVERDGGSLHVHRLDSSHVEFAWNGEFRPTYKPPLTRLTGRMPVPPGRDPHASTTLFTGLVEARGTVADVVPEDAGVRLNVVVPEPLAGSDAAIGDSVAINGCCLTIVAVDGSRWAFQAGTETLSKTNLGEMSAGVPVNLERALPANGRLGGHIVQGHVDGVGHVDRVDADGEWVDMWFRVPEPLARQMVPKGSVAVDGVSLTLVNVQRDRFSVALVPHTLDATTLGTRRAGDAVNVETDILGKYVQKFVEQMGVAKPHALDDASSDN